MTRQLKRGGQEENSICPAIYLLLCSPISFYLLLHDVSSPVSYGRNYNYLSFVCMARSFEHVM